MRSGRDSIRIVNGLLLIALATTVSAQITPPLYWENSDPEVSYDGEPYGFDFTYKEIDGARHNLPGGQGLGLNFSPRREDGYCDIIAAQYYYKNPGGDMMGTWERYPLTGSESNQVDGLLCVDVDGDEYTDVYAENSDVKGFWCEALNEEGTSWHIVRDVASLRPTWHATTQGYKLGDLTGDGIPEIIVSTGKEDLTGGPTYLEIPGNPEADPWPQHLVDHDGNEEGIAVADFDNDGDNDIANAKAGSNFMYWFENKGNFQWAKHDVGPCSKVDWGGSDRVEPIDFDQDGNMDIMNTTETSLTAVVRLFHNEGDAADWSFEDIFQGKSLNNADVADMDRDGDMDIVIAEHLPQDDPHRVIVLENDNKGENWIQHVVDNQGREGHLGARLWDLDGDGDFEIVNTAFYSIKYVHLWINNACSPDNPCGPCPQQPPVQVRSTPQRESLSSGARAMRIGGGIDFNLGGELAGAKRVTVHGVDGRFVAAVAVCQGRAQWDGRDRSGRAAPAGTYVYRIGSGAASDAGTFVVSR